MSEEKWLDRTSPQGEPQLRNPDRELMEFQLEEYKQANSRLVQAEIELSNKLAQVTGERNALLRASEEMQGNLLKLRQESDERAATIKDLQQQIQQWELTAEQQRKRIEILDRSATGADMIAKVRGEHIAKLHATIADMDATVRTCVQIAGRIIGGEINTEPPDVQQST